MPNVIVTGVDGARRSPTSTRWPSTGSPPCTRRWAARAWSAPSLRPIQDGARVAGSAVTVLCWPGDNLMIHAAVEQCRPGDMLVVTTVSPSLDGSFGELFATALQQRGVRGLVTTGGVRDVVDLRAMGFPAWAGAQSTRRAP